MSYQVLARKWRPHDFESMVGQEHVVAALRHALDENTAGITKLIVAQRVSTIMHAEKIIVLDEGTIVGIGTHSELMNNCETYREIAHSQLSKAELEGGAFDE